MNKKEIENFLLAKKGYLKKSPIEVAKVLWKNSSKHTLPKNESELSKELTQIKEVQINLRKAQTVVKEEFDTELIDIYHKILSEKNKPKRKLFFDIETSPNIVYSWRVGNKINIDSANIVEERAIICIAYKWSDESDIKSLQWSDGNDYNMLVKFSEIIDSADEVVGHNSDKFDIKWLRTRCIYHGIPISSKFRSIDTLKFARAGFNFNSNKLAYIGEFLGVGHKIDTGGFQLWKDVLNGSKEALNKMVEYCKGDVKLLENVYNELQEYSPVKKFRYGA